MAEHTSPRTRGFSLVEMVVALLFVGILMAGMAGVFKSSIATFYTAGEKISSARRSRTSIDLLYDDLNTAGMFLSDLTAPPNNISAANPAFYILPNQTVTGATASDPQTADQLFFYFDQPLPFEGQLAPAGSGTRAATASELVNRPGGAAMTAGIDDTYTVECNDHDYATQIKTGATMIFKDFWEPMNVKSVTVSGTVATITTGSNAASFITGIGPTGAPAKAVHINTSGVVFFVPGQMVRYSVQMLQLDPDGTTKLPCLVRDQGTYDPGGFVANGAPQIITENVQAFRVFLSCNAGSGWAPTAATTTAYGTNPSLTVGWLSGIKADLDTQLSASGRQGFTSTGASPAWFRSIPTLVRVDLTTRTAVKRGEYAATAGAAPAYNLLAQSLVMVPRHFGLPLN